MPSRVLRADPSRTRAEETARYDAMLFGACGEPYLRDLQTLAKVLDVDPEGLSSNALWLKLRPLVTPA